MLMMLSCLGRSVWNSMRNVTFPVGQGDEFLCTSADSANPAGFMQLQQKLGLHGDILSAIFTLWWLSNAPARSMACLRRACHGRKRCRPNLELPEFVNQAFL